MKRIVVIFIFLCFTFSVYAETIILKTGKKVEGKIIERTEGYVKVDLQGVPLTYYFEDIESIDGEVFTSSPAGSMSWEQFDESISEYNLKMEAFMDKTKLIVLSQNEGLQKAMKMDDREQAGRVIAETSGKLAELIRELKLLKAPPELRIYHKKMVEAYENRKMANDEMLAMNREAANKYNRKAKLLGKEAMVEMRRICIKYNAPREVIEALSQVIDLMSNSM